MARTKSNQRSASRAAAAVPMGATGSRTPPSKLTVSLFAVSIIAAVWALAMMTPFGRVGYLYFFAYSEFYMGVLSLVSLSITIMLGLVATDRLVLSIRQRVLLQSAHRTVGMIAVLALFLHLWTKLMESHIGLIDIFIPFLHTGNTFAVGLGTLSGWVMVLSMWTGIVRSKFIGRGKPWMWRAIHAFSYLMWPIALVHGLSAGRPAAVWVVVSYVVCVLGVLLGLAVRISVSLNRKKDFASSAGTGPGSMKPVGQLVPTTSPAMKRPSRRAAMDSAGSASGRGGGTSAAVLEQWEPAAQPKPAPVSPAPGLSGPSPISAPPARPVSSPPGEPRRRPRREEQEYEAPRPRVAEDDDYYDAPAARRYAEDEPPPPRRRSARAEMAERFSEETQTISRRAIEAERRAFEEDRAEPAPRARRRPDDFETQRYVPEDARPRTRRYADEDDEPPRRAPRVDEVRQARAEPQAKRRVRDEEPRPEAPRRARAELEAAPRPRRYAEDDEPRARRYAEEEPPARGRRYAEADVEPEPERVLRSARRRPVEDAYDEAPRPRGPRYPNDDPPPTGRRRPERGAEVDRSDSGRHSRSEFVDMAPQRGGDWRDSAGAETDPDDMPTLVDMATRRALRAEQQEAPVRASRGARRGRGRGNEMADDDQYWRQLRGEAQ